MSFRSYMAGKFTLALLSCVWCFGCLLFFYFRDHDPLIGVLSLPFGIMAIIGIMIFDTNIEEHK